MTCWENQVPQGILANRRLGHALSLPVLPLLRCADGLAPGYGPCSSFWPYCEVFFGVQPPSDPVTRRSLSSQKIPIEFERAQCLGCFVFCFTFSCMTCLSRCALRCRTQVRGMSFSDSTPCVALLLVCLGDPGGLYRRLAACS